MAATLSLFSECEAPEPKRLTGVARQAAQATTLDTRNTVRYAGLAARSILNRCDSARVPFAWTLNPYRGCEFGCQYCYARYTHEFMELRGSTDFERQIFVKQRAAALLKRDLHRVGAEEWIALGTATDPYQPAERHYRVTQSLLEVFAEGEGRKLSITTKSALVTRDLTLLQRIAGRNQLHIGITVTSMEAALARALEPRAPLPDVRMGAVAKLAECGLEVGVMCAPVLPGITDSRAALQAVAEAASRAGARFFHAQALFLQPAAQARYFPFLAEHYPALLERYGRAYARSAYLPASYTGRLRARVAQIRRACGLDGGGAGRTGATTAVR
ncbi:MAG: radical SAM protein [Terriglobales bacterium]